MLVPTHQHSGTTVRRGDRSNRQSAAGPGRSQPYVAYLDASQVRTVSGRHNRPGSASASVWPFHRADIGLMGPLPTPQKSVNRTNRAV
jgi:hypothetical protein